ncbi:hypothetical protein AGMMS50284_7070 [Clostridia bacterium]|nr:hypothetical protein AGMMS50284_7070 [Clostridia bacterium]
MIKKIICVFSAAVLMFSFSACGKDKTETAEYNLTGVTVPNKSNENDVFDFTQSYKDKPYSNDYAIERKSELDGLNNATLFSISASKELPQFYRSFFIKPKVYNVSLEKYDYNLAAETINEYFDTWEYSRFVNWGETKVIDTFVIDDTQSNSYLYYCYYTATILGDGNSTNVVTYYRDTASINKKTLEITIVQSESIKESVSVPKEISGDNDFTNVI